jgi:hypothetical protein
VGVALLEALVELARQSHLSLLHADVLHVDAFSLRILGRYGRLQVLLDYGAYSVFLHLEEPDLPIQLPNYLTKFVSTQQTY